MSAQEFSALLPLCMFCFDNCLTFNGLTWHFFLKGFFQDKVFNVEKFLTDQLF